MDIFGGPSVRNIKDVDTYYYCRKVSRDFKYYKYGKKKNRIKNIYPAIKGSPIKKNRERIDNICFCRFKQDTSMDLNPHSLFFLIITDKDFIFKYAYPLFEDSIRKMIDYSYSQNRDSSFTNIFESKQIINDTIFYSKIKNVNQFAFFIVVGEDFSERKDLLKILNKDGWEPKYICDCDLRLVFMFVIIIPLLEG